MAVVISERDAKRFGRNVCLHRERRGYSLIDLAERTGLTKDSVYKIEMGMRSARLASILALADALDIHPCELLEGLRP